MALEMVWKFALGLAVVLVLGAVALSFYGARVERPTSTVEQVLPDSRFPR